MLILTMNHDCNWQIISASVAGKSHEKQDIPCQDAHNWKLLSNQIIIMAVADGAGSAKLSDLGSKLAVNTAIEVLEQQLNESTIDPEKIPWQEYLTQTLKAAQIAIETEASRQNAEIRDFATTLILMIAAPEWVAVAQVGDGAAVVEDQQGTLLGLTIPTSGEYLNETVFLVSPNAVETAQLNLWSGQPKYLAVFSDGLQMLALKMPEGKPYHPFFSPLFKFVETATDETDAKEQLISFLRSPRVTNRTDDDLTLILGSFHR